MKNFTLSFGIISSLCIVLFSCETDEPPSIKADISGVWVLDELYSVTYQNETEVIYEVDIPVYGERVEFLEEGLYLVGTDPDPEFNEQLGFAFASQLQNYEIDSTASKIFGTWESHINVDGDNIMHFDKFVNGQDSYMFLDNIDENSMTMTMVVNNNYSDINISNFVPLAEYQASWDARRYTEFYFNEGFAYEDGYDVGETVGYYDGYFDTYSYEPDPEEAIKPEYYIFNLIYGDRYADTFSENYDPALADPEFDIGLGDGYAEGYAKGESEAIQHDNGKDKSVTLTYEFTRN